MGHERFHRLLRHGCLLRENVSLKRVDNPEGEEVFLSYQVKNGSPSGLPQKPSVPAGIGGFFHAPRVFA
jgi:hypothetical protein